MLNKLLTPIIRKRNVLSAIVTKVNHESPQILGWVFSRKSGLKTLQHIVYRPFHNAIAVVGFSFGDKSQKSGRGCEMDGIALRLAKKLFDQRLIQSQFRSAYVKEMVEPYLGVEGWRYIERRPSRWDFECGEDRLVVKQSVAQQPWSDVRGVRARGIFDISAKEDGSGSEPSRGRCAQTYVFAWHPVFGDEADHRNSSQWEFYVVSASVLPNDQRKISLSRIRGLQEPTKIENLAMRCSMTAFDRARTETAIVYSNWISQAG